MNNKLLNIAELLSEEIRQEKWNDIIDNCIPITQNQRIIKELSKRCPGFKIEEYKEALSIGMQNTR
jgi:hypothetical protein